MLFTSGVWPRVEKGAVKVADGIQYTRSNRGSTVNIIPKQTTVLVELQNYALRAIIVGVV